MCCFTLKCERSQLYLDPRKNPEVVAISVKEPRLYLVVLTKTKQWCIIQPPCRALQGPSPAWTWEECECTFFIMQLWHVAHVRLVQQSFSVGVQAANYSHFSFYLLMWGPSVQRFVSGLWQYIHLNYSFLVVSSQHQEFWGLLTFITGTKANSPTLPMCRLMLRSHYHWFPGYKI